MNDETSLKVTPFPVEESGYPISSVDQAFVKLAAAILEEPEELVLAAMLASRQRTHLLDAA